MHVGTLPRYTATVAHTLGRTYRAVLARRHTLRVKGIIE